MHITTRLSRPNLQAAGTGIVLSSSGLVLTNHHVVNDAVSITVTNIGNGQTYPAAVVDHDSTRDIAVLQIQDATGLATAPIGDSDSVEVGDDVAAIGNAGGRGGTPSITSGRVTALNRTVTVSDSISGDSQRLTGMIRVSAHVEPGNSGGPLVNAAGQVVGVVTAGSGGSPSAGGEGFAIPINDAISISNQIGH